MVNVAIAGGTGALGRVIVEAFQNSPHKTFVLSRKAGLSPDDGWQK